MASFEQHITQAKRNLKFLVTLNGNVEDCFDWQVTTCFYGALHLADAYLAERGNIHPSSHKDRKNYLNPYTTTSPYRFSSDTFLSYTKLESWSKRARYLCHDDPTQDQPEIAFQTYDRHLSKAIKKLDDVLHFFVTRYPHITIDQIKLKCSEITVGKLKFIEIVK